MARTKAKPKPPAAVLGSLEAVDVALADLGTAERCVQVMAAELEERIAAVRSECVLSMGPAREKAARVREILEASAEAHPEWFSGARRSVDLAHGRIGWRKVTSIRLKWAAEKVVAALRSRGLVNAIITKESPNKDVLATYDARTLDALGAKSVSRDEFYVDLAETPTQKE